MENKYLDHLPVGYVGFTGRDMLPSWAITHYLEQFCINHMKLVIIQKICQLTSLGVPDSCFSVSSSSAELFPSKSLSEKSYTNTIEYFDQFSSTSLRYLEESPLLSTRNSVKNIRKNTITASKEENSDYFWYIIQNYKRPIVLIKDNNQQLPLFDFDSSEAAKIWNLKVQSPPEGIIRAAIGAAIDLAFASKNEARAMDEHINRQLGQTTRNLGDLARTSQFINNPNTPEGVKRYAEHSLMLIMKRQADLNEKIGIRDITINTQI